MDRYNIGEFIADGEHSSVKHAIKKESKQNVVIKRPKKLYYNWDDAVNTREIQALLRVRHENVVKLKEVIREKNHIYLIFEPLDGALTHLIKSMENDFTEDSIITIMWQILQGIKAIHDKGFIHRNLTTDNILCKVPNIIKIGGFTSIKDNMNKFPYTPNIGDKIVQSPETLLGSTEYKSTIDIWAAGALMAHLYLRKPLFYGATDKDFLFRICQVLGTPDKRYSTEIVDLANKKKYEFATMTRKPLTRTIVNASNQAVLLMHDMLRWVPARRPSAQTCLAYPYFNEKAAAVALEDDKAKSERSDLSSSSANSMARRANVAKAIDNDFPPEPKISYYNTGSNLLPDPSRYPPARRLYRYNNHGFDSSNNLFNGGWRMKKRSSSFSFLVKASKASTLHCSCYNQFYAY